ncbi:hypothetical protein ACGFZB_38595 [Streptomyces cinerochromogenes]|uniref:Uncharacterized protein n=1 Tax=Streptomyces cinerochromogenes TaxID=66422 RepID=A0ABW7BK44_9ACTN
MVARMLNDHLGAASVSFITDFTGGSVVRLGAAGSVETDAPARLITLRGTLYDDVSRTHRSARSFGRIESKHRSPTNGTGTMPPSYVASSRRRTIGTAGQ